MSRSLILLALSIAAIAIMVEAKDPPVVPPAKGLGEKLQRWASRSSDTLDGVPGRTERVIVEQMLAEEKLRRARIERQILEQNLIKGDKVILSHEDVQQIYDLVQQIYDFTLQQEETIRKQQDEIKRYDSQLDYVLDLLRSCQKKQ